MKRKKKIANALMGAAIVVIVAFGVMFVLKLRGIL